jgi:hypothetical protein
MPYLNEVVGLAVGGVASAFCGTRFVSAIKNEHLIKTIAALLAALGVLNLFEVVYPFHCAQVIPAGAAFHFGAGFALGIIIGLVSSILGVAGGELLIPTMMFIFGADIKTAGTASIVISILVVTSGLWRYWQSGAMETRVIPIASVRDWFNAFPLISFPRVRERKRKAALRALIKIKTCFEAEAAPDSSPLARQLRQLRKVRRNPPHLARLYKRQSRRPMSENRRLRLSPHAPSSSSAQKGIVGYQESVQLPPADFLWPLAPASIARCSPSDGSV